jgi:hypothetical protein
MIELFYFGTGASFPVVESCNMRGLNPFSDEYVYDELAKASRWSQDQDRTKSRKGIVGVLVRTDFHSKFQ